MTQSKPLSHSPSQTTIQTISHRPWFIVFCLLALVNVTGCSGCFEGAETIEERQERLKKEKPLDDFDPPEMVVLPADDRESQLNRVKPGHWTSLSTTLKANNFDFRGELYAYTTDQSNQPVQIPKTDYYFSSTRPLVLPKGQSRSADVLYYPPPFSETGSASRLFACDVRPRGGGRPVVFERIGTTRMHPHEYYMVVLSASSDEYQFLNATDVLRPLHGLVSAELAAPHYRLVLPKVIDDRVTVPENTMAWTSTAYVFWDGINPERLSFSQQQALLDWLHFGGQLVISGPDSLNQLKLSFLADYLPADDGGSIELGDADFAEINDHFVTTERINEGNRFTKKRYAVDLRAGSLRGTNLKLRPEATYVENTGKMVAERQVGRGRIAVTAFQIKSPDISKNWKNFDTFLNAVLLRRPPRKFKTDEDGNPVSVWKDDFAVNDPRLVTSLRFFSRDLDSMHGNFRLFDRFQLEGELTEDGNRDDRNSTNLQLKNSIEKANPMGFAGFDSNSQAGIAGWNDESGVSVAARECLREAAGINIPKGSFVLRITAAYLIVLVPVNWFVFWMMGRVEWAWIAAPIIAIVGAVSVVKLAELDIGFARSRTEVAFLETHAGYNRSHLTRYTSLYTSLGTNYDIEFSEPTAVSLPFGRGATAVSNQSRRFATSASEVQYLQEGNDILLDGLQVASNSSTMIHSEYFLSNGEQPLFSWEAKDDETMKLTFGGEFPMVDTAVIRRNESGKLEGAWIGKIQPFGVRSLKFQPISDNWEVFPQWTQSTTFGVESNTESFNLRHLLNAAKDLRQLQPGETRLIGWTEQDLPGMEFSPAANQRTIRTLILAHLDLPTWGAPMRDANTRRFLGQEPEAMRQNQLDAIDSL